MYGSSFENEEVTVVRRSRKPKRHKMIAREDERDQKKLRKTLKREKRLQADLANANALKETSGVNIGLQNAIMSVIEDDLTIIRFGDKETYLIPNGHERIKTISASEGKPFSVVNWDESCYMACSVYKMEHYLALEITRIHNIEME